jgi:hypothetical protein
MAFDVDVDRHLALDCPTTTTANNDNKTPSPIFYDARHCGPELNMLATGPLHIFEAVSRSDSHHDYRPIQTEFDAVADLQSPRRASSPASKDKIRWQRWLEGREQEAGRQPRVRSTLPDMARANQSSSPERVLSTPPPRVDDLLPSSSSSAIASPSPALPKRAGRARANQVGPVRTLRQPAPLRGPPIRARGAVAIQPAQRMPSQAESSRKGRTRAPPARIHEVHVHRRSARLAGRDGQAKVEPSDDRDELTLKRVIRGPSMQ